MEADENPAEGAPPQHVLLVVDVDVAEVLLPAVLVWQFAEDLLLEGVGADLLVQVVIVHIHLFVLGK